jgi:hypothetical protein
MRENRTSGSEGGAAQPNASSLPLCAPRRAGHQEGSSPSLARCCLPVIESNCVARRRGGEQLKMNNQSVIPVNPIRPDDVTSLRGNGEVLHTRLPAVNGCTTVSRETYANTGLPGRHQVVVGGMVGRCPEITWETPAELVPVRGVRAPIVAMKRGSSRGAKGGRKMDA